MTDRLYYNDPYLREFDATVLATSERGGRLAVTLDRTAFYPTSGGQPFDTGTLGPYQVVEVVDEDDGSVVHVVEEAVDRAGTETGSVVHGVIDWARRFDHMQQHTGQHVLSAAFARLFDVRTVSFHMGAETSTIDLAREVTADEIARAEDLANQVVWEDRQVAIRYADAEEAARLPLRKEPVRGGTLRLIDVGDFDLSACGGTHVARTGAIGIIAVAGWERFKGGQRLEFLCGRRVLRRWRSLRDHMTASVRLLSVLPAELPGAIERMQSEAKEQKRALAGLQTDLARFRADALAARGVPLSGDNRDVTLVAQAIDADANGLKSLASAIAERPGFAVVLVSTASPSLVVVARAANVRIKANDVLGALVKEFGGRGGGRPELAQGGGLAGEPASILVSATEAMKRSS